MSIFGSIGRGIAKGVGAVGKGVSAPFRSSGDNMGITDPQPQTGFQQALQNTGNIMARKMPWNMRPGLFGRTGTDYANQWQKQRNQNQADLTNFQQNYWAPDRDQVLADKQAALNPQPQQRQFNWEGVPINGGVVGIAPSNYRMRKY